MNILKDYEIKSFKVDRKYIGSIIGYQGKYIKKLEQNYNVRIILPNENEDDILIKGNKSQIIKAYEEIEDIVNYEKNNTREC